MSKRAHSIHEAADKGTGGRVHALKLSNAAETVRDRRCLGTDGASGEGLVPEPENEVEANQDQTTGR